MSRRRDRADAGEASRPVAEMPEHLQIFDAADWLEPGVTEPPDGYDEAAWEAFDAARQRAYQAHLAARREWEATHELPPLRLVPDEPYTPPPNKVDGRVMGAASEPRLPLGEGPRGAARADGLAGRDARYRRRRDG